MQGFMGFMSSFFMATVIHPDYKWQLLYYFIILQLLVMFFCQWIRKAIYCSESDLCKKLCYIEVMHMFQNYFMVLVNFILFFNITFNVQLLTVLCLTIIINLCISRGIPKTNIVQYAPGLLCGGLNIMQFILLMIVYYLLSLIFYYVSYLMLYYFITYPIDLEDMFCIVCDYQDLWSPGWLAIVEFFGTLLVEWIMIRKLIKFRYIAEIFCSSAISAFLLMAGYPFVFVFLNPTISTIKLYSCSKYDPMPTFMTNWLPPILGAVLGHVLFACDELERKTETCSDGKGDE